MGAAPGALAEWLGSGLQSRLQRFDSARRLYDNGLRHSVNIRPFRVVTARPGRVPR
jgi:hypothetical protein